MYVFLFIPNTHFSQRTHAPWLQLRSLRAARLFSLLLVTFSMTVRAPNALPDPPTAAQPTLTWLGPHKLSWLVRSSR
ncbi:hypothetical protein BC827DRAFT_1249832 [Russula dissimulans]|nr:hypothetical protein BC827DRAFT_1249832 [Russula dissimulans]